jgi:pimeloyl-ACP methyl ester carboxylesterase
MELAMARPTNRSSKPQKKTTRASSPPKPSAFEKAMEEMRLQRESGTRPVFQPVSAKWLLGALAAVLVGAAVCGWLVLCLLFWQGHWQLLYHPKAAITRTPASVGLAFEPVKFAATETGVTQLTGWWVPIENARFTVLYLHGADGNLSDSVDMLAALHRNGLAVFAVDYRGYGLSTGKDALPRPSEKQFRQDAEWSLSWLTQMRHLPADRILIAGSGLGANLAAEVAADHSELAGVILDEPLSDAMAPVYGDSRSRLVPVSWMVKDRWDLATAAGAVRVPSLWLLAQGKGDLPAVVGGTKVWLRVPVVGDPFFDSGLRRWLDDLPGPR